MTRIRTVAGYEKTRDKLTKLEQRLANLGRRTDLSQLHLTEAQRSCKQMIAQYRRELKLYEAANPESTAKS